MKDVMAETKTNRKTNQIKKKKKPIKKKKKKKKKKTISEISVCPNKLSYNVE
jgi:hypothetical protein